MSVLAFEQPASLTTAGLVESCLKKFDTLIGVIAASDAVDGQALLAVAPWEDERGRLRIWSANIGAHRKGKSSLDYRVRDDSDIRNQVVDLLQGLHNRLYSAEKLLVEGEDSGSESFQETFVDDTEPQIQRLHGFIRDRISCLYRMTILIRKPAQSDFTRGGGAAKALAFLPFDLDNLRSKYPDANDSLILRLGRAMTRRRRYLSYRSRHHAKLSHEPDDGSDVGSDELSDTVATTLQRHNIEDGKGERPVGKSVTSFATGFLNGSDTAMPKQPKAGLTGIPFECPYCFCIVIAPNTRSWVKHIFDDLRPYVCTALDCPTPNQMFVHRHEWLHHLEEFHPKGWHEVRKSGISVCPLCTTNLVKDNMASHVAHHLQELSLSVLPVDDEITEADETADKGHAEPEDETSSDDEKIEILKDGRRTTFAQPQPDLSPILRPMERSLRGGWPRDQQIEFVQYLKVLGTDWKAIAWEMEPRSEANVRSRYFYQVSIQSDQAVRSGIGTIRRAERVYMVLL